MCINCNLMAPLNHYVCELLDIPKNQYSIVSNSMDILDHLIISISLDYKHNETTDGKLTIKLIQNDTNERSKKMMELYLFLKNNDLYKYIETLVKENISPSCVDRNIINYLCYEYFDNNWVNESTTLENCRIPLDLLASDVQRMKSLFGKTQYCQKEIIPEDLVNKIKLTREKTDLYDFHMLENQNFYIS